MTLSKCVRRIGVTTRRNRAPSEPPHCWSGSHYSWTLSTSSSTSTLSAMPIRTPCSSTAFPTRIFSFQIALAICRVSTHNKLSPSLALSAMPTRRQSVSGSELRNRLIDAGLLSPDLECFGTGAAVTGCCHAMTSWAKVTADHRVRRQKALRLTGRLEPQYLPLTTAHVVGSDDANSQLDCSGTCSFDGRHRGEQHVERHRSYASRRRRSLLA
jgi:hypothetical protein